MPALLGVASLLLLVSGALLAAREARRRRAETHRLAAEIRELTARVRAAERDAGRAAAAADATAAVLVDKGVADEQELAAARQRSAPATPGDAHGARTVH